MKTQLLTLIGLIFILNYSFSQQDKQWLILTGKGKNQTSGYTNSIGQQFTISGVVLPDIASQPKAGNDLLVIYDDGTHFNARSHTEPGFFYNPNDAGSGLLIHNFSKSTTGSIIYLYLTNRYEIDDPPSRVSVRPGTDAEGSAPPYPLGITTPGLLSANHDVVYNKDITIIIDYLAADSVEVSGQNGVGDHFIKLKFDAVKNLSTGVVSVPPKFLDLRPVFGDAVTSLTSAVYPYPVPNPGSNAEIILQPDSSGKRYRYVNLRPNQLLQAFAPAPNGEPRYNAVFSLIKNNVTINKWEEGIRLSHDPNFLKVESICRSEDGSHYVTYRLQFENYSTVPVDSLSASLTFPDHFDLGCLKTIKWHAAGFACHGNVSINGQNAVFDFIDEQSLIRRSPANADQAIGYVVFKVKVNPGMELNDLENSLRLNHSLVFFDDIKFEVEEFRDLIFCKGYEPDGAESSYAINPKKSINKGQPESKAKSDTMAKSGTEQYSSQSISGSNDCFRPVTRVDCYCSPPFCWICIFGGIVVAALLAIIFLRRRRRRTVS